MSCPFEHGDIVYLRKIPGLKMVPAYLLNRPLVLDFVYNFDSAIGSWPITVWDPEEESLLSFILTTDDITYEPPFN